MDLEYKKNITNFHAFGMKETKFWYSFCGFPSLDWHKVNLKSLQSEENKH